MTENNITDYAIANSKSMSKPARASADKKVRATMEDAAVQLRVAEDEKEEFMERKMKIRHTCGKEYTISIGQIAQGCDCSGKKKAYKIYKNGTFHRGFSDGFKHVSGDRPLSEHRNIGLLTYQCSKKGCTNTSKENSGKGGYCAGCKKKLGY